MKIYTRKGDDGTTQLLSGDRVAKDDLRLEVEGTLDELNSCLGAALSHLEDEKLAETVRTLQGKLFVLGALVAGAQADDSSSLLSDAEVLALEQTIDDRTASLPPLRAFVLPGGAPAGAHLHVARTVCRRLERRLTSLAGREPVTPAAQRFVNRLADLLFVLARSANHRAGVGELTWGPEHGNPTPQPSGNTLGRRAS
ncbi:MAG: ATP:cob(I)alamin adenosyltransferase [Armatimonadetes bacterium CG_4_8_14_3_um_filter_66_20]|nr:MAG: ATP:cob(I)alamin adenosyltransferase [Armatimonadetes bacterium CG_4_8_14_3_um_filter_66_20]